MGKNRNTMTPELIKSVVDKTDSKPIEKNQLFCYFAIMFTNLRLIDIGAIINRSHTDVIYSRRVVINRKNTDLNYSIKVEELKMSLKSLS